MPQLLHNSKFVNWFRRTFSLGSNTDVRPELMKDGLYSDGTLDNTFNIGTGFTGGTGPIVIDILVTTLGDIIVSGVFTALDGTPRFYVAKF